VAGDIDDRRLRRSSQAMPWGQLVVDQTLWGRSPLRDRAKSFVAHYRALIGE